MTHLLPAKLLLLALLCTSLGLQAQPTITASTVVQLGESAPVQFAQGSFNPGPAGANVSYDFSQLQDDNLAYTWEALAPTSTPFTDSFPNANLAFRTPVQGANEESWVYYDWNAATQVLDLHGSASVINTGMGQDTFYYLLTPGPKQVQTFPFSYGDSFTDNFNGRSIVNFGSFAVNQTRTGSITVEADGYGDLSTPAGSFQNVLRIRTTEQITDTYQGAVTNQTITRYSWYSADEKYLLLHMDSIVVQPMGGPANTSISIFYRDGAPTVALDEAQLASEWGLLTFPNPAHDRVTVRYQLPDPAPARISLRNLVGQEMRGQDIHPASGLASLDLQGLAPGIYLLQLQQGAQTATRKLILH